MHEKFDDPLKAICYLGVGLGEDYPNAVVEVVFHAGERLHSELCKVRDAAQLLEHLCHKFPRASVHYDPEAEDAVVGMIRCHCQENIKLKCCHHKSKDRPVVTVRLVSIGDMNILATPTNGETRSEHQV